MSVAAQVLVTTLLWLGLVAAVVLFWFYGMPVLMRWQRRFGAWIQENPFRLILVMFVPFAAALLGIVWYGIFQLIGEVS